MYNDYFGFGTAPFSIAPNPHFLYMSERHREALAHLLYGIRSDGGFILLTGEVGTGKTTVCRCLLEQIPEDVDTAFILNPKLTADELLATACDDLGVPYPEGASIKALTDALNAFLLSSLEQGRKTVLIIDEAQNLSADVLEQLRLLTNLETNQRKLLQIILLGQPELLDMLEKKELRQLSQRITARFHLDALDSNDVASYIAHRIELAGGNPALFSGAAVKRVYQLSGGVPRLINLICDRALLGTYAESRLRVEAGVVEQAAKEIFGRERRARPPAPVPVAAAALAFLAVVTTLFMVYGPDEGQPEPAATVTNAKVNTANVGTDDADSEATAATAADSRDENETEAAATQTPAANTATEITASIRPLDVQPVDPLLAVEGDSSARDAVARLVATWDIPPSALNGDPCAAVRDFRLSCFRFLGTFSDLENLNRPAVIKLTLAREEHYLTVSRIEGNVVTVLSGSGSYRLRKQDILNTWDGEFTLLWRPPPQYRLVSKGDSGGIVEQLSRQLSLVSETPVTRTFDDTVEAQLKQFQLSVRLPPDGIAGERTWIHLNRATGLDGPSLTGEQS